LVLGNLLGLTGAYWTYYLLNKKGFQFLPLTKYKAGNYALIFTVFFLLKRYGRA
jgi:hypothetical protein